MDSGNQPEETTLKPPGLGSKPEPITVNGHVFSFRKRTFYDFIRVRAYALSLMTPLMTPDVAAELIARHGFEFKIAELAIGLDQAPEHWKTKNEFNGEMIITPEVVDYDGDGHGEFVEVYQGYLNFLELFRNKGK